MKIRNFRLVEGKFDSQVDPSRTHRRVTCDAILVAWEWRPDGDEPWREEQLLVPAGYSWNGTSRPAAIGWLIPKWGVFSLASLIHDFCFVEGPYLSDRNRISRKHTDLLFMSAMQMLAEERVPDGVKAHAQLWMAEVMYRAVRWFGTKMWNAHEFRA